MELTKENLTKVIRQAKKIQKEMEILKEYLEPINDTYYAIDPPNMTFWTDIIPEIKEIMGGTIRTNKSPFGRDEFEASLVVDGVRFVDYRVPMTEKERYEK